MRIAALTNVNDDSRTMLSGGLALQRLSPLQRSHQCFFGHLNAAVHLVTQDRFSANNGRRQGPGMLLNTHWCGPWVRQRLLKVDRSSNELHPWRLSSGFPLRSAAKPWL